MRLTGQIKPLDRLLRAAERHRFAFCTGTQAPGAVLFAVLFVALGFTSTVLHADTMQIEVGEVKVYAAPNVGSDVITTLFKGDIVPVSRNPVPGFKKVLIKDASQKKIGYIRIADLGGNPAPRTAVVASKQPVQRPGTVQPRGTVARKVIKTPHNRHVLGLFLGLNYQNQGSRTQNSNGTNASIGVLSGTSFQGGLFYDFPLSYNFSIRAYGEYKSVSVTGTATYQASNVTPTPTSTFLNETFLTVGALATIYPGARSNWWWGPGLQADVGMSGTLQYGSISPVALTGTNLPTFIYGYVATGYNFRLGPNFVLIPDLRIGGVLNALPIILEADVHANIGYVF